MTRCIHQGCRRHGDPWCVKHRAALVRAIPPSSDRIRGCPHCVYHPEHHTDVMIEGQWYCVDHAPIRGRELVSYMEAGL